MASPNIATEIILKDPATLTGMVANVRPAPRFLMDRYFPINQNDMLRTKYVLVDYKDKNGRLMAPAVHKGHKTTDRTGFTTDLLKPERLAPQRTINVEDLQERIFAEPPVNGSMTPADRAMEKYMEDMTDLANETRCAWENMAAQLMQKNEYTLNYVKSDKNGSSEEVGEKTVSYNDPDDVNLCKYEPQVKWGADGANIYADLKLIVDKLEQNGGRAVDVILGSNAADALLHDPRIQKLLDIRRYNLGAIEPTFLELGAALLGQLNINGRVLNLIEYSEGYKEGDQLKRFIDPNKIVMTYPGSGRPFFCEVTQLEQRDNWFHTYLAAMTPKLVGDVESDEFCLKMTSRPLFAPVVKGGWVSATVLD